MGEDEKIRTLDTLTKKLCFSYIFQPSCNLNHLLVCSILFILIYKFLFLYFFFIFFTFINFGPIKDTKKFVLLSSIFFKSFNETCFFTLFLVFPSFELFKLRTISLVTINLPFTYILNICIQLPTAHSRSQKMFIHFFITVSENEWR